MSIAVNSSLCVIVVMGVLVGNTNGNSVTRISNTCMQFYIEISVVCIELVCIDSYCGKRL